MMLNISNNIDWLFVLNVNLVLIKLGIWTTFGIKEKNWY